MSARTLPLALAALLALAGCASARRDAPAVIVDPAAEHRAVLAVAVAEALGGAPVALSDDALTRSSTLSVERGRGRGPDGLPLLGRDLGSPERFRLVLRGGACLLVHEGSGRERALPGLRCAPVGPPAR